tara:strand:+ start:136 stop:756 length:621 start_codon:yes stop_codon:yes gene_type:complete
MVKSPDMFMLMAVPRRIEIMQKLLACAALAILFVQNPASAEIPEDRFTLLPTFYIDTDRGNIAWVENGVKASGAIADCSDSDLHCLKSDKISVVWPRKCGFYVSGDSAWSHEGITTRVVGYTTRVIHHTGLTTRYPIIMTDGIADTAFVLDGARIRGAFFAEGGEDLRTLIAARNDAEAFDLIDAPPADVTYSPVLSSQPLGICDQ